MRFLITGGTGFIGSHFQQSALAHEEHEVVILTRSEKASNHPRLHYVQWNGRKIPAEVGEIDVILNLAGANIADKAWTASRKMVLVDSRVDATNACVSFIKASEHKPKVFLSCSAIGIYGGDNPTPSDEDAPLGSDFMATLCQRWEDAAADAGIRTIIFRTPIVLDAKEGALPKMAMPFKLFVGGVLGSGKQGISWIHVEDFIDLLWRFVEDESLKGIINACTPNYVDNAELSKELAAALGRPNLFWVPSFVMKLLLGERAIIVLGGQKVIPRRLQEVEYSFKFPTLREALQDLYNK